MLRSIRGPILRSVAAILVLLLGWALTAKLRSPSPPRVYRMGVDSWPPLSEIGPDGKPMGFAVEVLNEAARRRHISLQWIFTTMNSDEALKSGLVDLWPVVGVTEARRRMHHLTEPWFFNTFCLIEKRGNRYRTPGDVTNKKVAFTGYPLATELARQHLPGAQLVKMPYRGAVLEAVCSGEVAAGFDEASFTTTLILDRPRACWGVPLKINMIKDAVAAGALGSTMATAAIADELRHEITIIASDGAMAASLDRWSSFSVNETRSVLAMQADGQQRKRLLYGLLAALLASGCLFWQARRAASARKAAEQASTVKSEFLANMSHEIRTPLNGVLGLLNIVLDGEIAPAERKHIEIAKQSGEVLLALLNDVLDLSTVEAGKLRIEKTEFHLRNTLNDLIRFFEPACREKGLSLRLDFPAGIPSLFHGDQNRIRQIVTNFVGNALKFTDQGSIAISVDSQVGVGSKPLIRISVQDTGVGIPPDLQKQLFQKFTQVDGSPSRRYGGTGLGLAISKHLAEIMGGSVGMSSSHPHGSVFWVELPLQAAVERETGPLLEPEPVALPAGQFLPPVSRRILIAEDNAVNQYVLTRSLQKLGYHVDVAPNGIEAVKRWENTDYDAILMDCQMPEMDGYEATRTIRQGKTGNAAIPIIAVTTHTMAGDEERCRTAGMNGFLGKPLKIAELERIMKEYAPTDSV